MNMSVFGFERKSTYKTVINSFLPPKNVTTPGAQAHEPIRDGATNLVHVNLPLSSEGGV